MTARNVLILALLATPAFAQAPTHRAVDELVIRGEDHDLAGMSSLTVSPTGMIVVSTSKRLNLSRRSRCSRRPGASLAT
jgi:hypothetical protein